MIEAILHQKYGGVSAWWFCPIGTKICNCAVIKIFHARIISQRKYSFILLWQLFGYLDFVVVFG